MKKTKIGQQAPAPALPTAKQALARLAKDIRGRGITLPLSEPIGPSDRGLSLALIIVEDEIAGLAAAAPRDNPAHTTLFSLPPARHDAGASTEEKAPHVPPQKVVTGDAEVDAVLWLREVIQTGQADLIEDAHRVASRIKTPLRDLEKRYTDYLMRAHPGDWTVGLKSLGFADLTGLALRALVRHERLREARSRFGDGDAIFEQTPAERFCEEALDGVPPEDSGWYLDKELVDQRFDAAVEQRPGTLRQCVAELAYWSLMYWLRDAVGGTAAGDGTAATQAREAYVFRMLSRIPPRDPEEAAEVLRWLDNNDGMDRAQTFDILMNLVGAPEPYHPHDVGGANA